MGPSFAEVTAPVRVRFTAPTDTTVLRDIGLERGCAGLALTGDAVGGTLDAPIVVTDATAGCSATKLTDTHRLVVTFLKPG